MSQTKAQLVAPVGIVTASSFAVSDGTAGAPSIRFSDSSTTGIYSPGSNQFAITTNGVGRITIDASGNVVAGGTLTAGSFIPTSSTVPTNGLYLSAANTLALATNSAGRVFVDASGNLGVGATPGGGYKLEISGTADTSALFNTTSADGTHLRFATSGTVKHYLGSAPGLTGSGTDSDFAIRSAGYFAIATNGNNERLRITSAGLVGIGTSSVDRLFIASDSADNNLPCAVITKAVAGGANSGLQVHTAGTDAGAGAYCFRVTAGNTYGSPTSEYLRVTAAGRVGIGSNLPQSPLHVNGSGDVAIQITNGSTGSGATDGAQITVEDPSMDLVLRNRENATIRFLTNNTERGRWDASGRLLVGTSSALTGSASQFSKLQVHGNTANAQGCYLSFGYGGVGTSLSAGADIATINFTDTAAGQFASIRCDTDGTTGSGDYPGRLVFSTTADGAGSPTERMRISSSGSTLFNANSGDGASVVINNNIASTFGLSIYDNANSGWLARFYDNSSVIAGSITRSGTTVAYNTSSDYRLKENVASVTDGITRLQQLKPRRFNFIADPERTVDGFIAHEVQSVVPEAIHGNKDAVDDDGKPVYQGIDQSKLVPLLTAALQEAIGRIETLEIEKELQQTVLDDLLARVVALETK